MHTICTHGNIWKYYYPHVFWSLQATARNYAWISISNNMHKYTISDSITLWHCGCACMYNGIVVLIFVWINAYIFTNWPLSIISLLGYLNSSTRICNYVIFITYCIKVIVLNLFHTYVYNINYCNMSLDLIACSCCIYLVSYTCVVYAFYFICLVFSICTCMATCFVSYAVHVHECIMNLLTPMYCFGFFIW